MDDLEKLSATPPVYPGRGETCPPNQAWSCTIQCAPGTRFPAERLFNAPGVEVCIVGACSCQPLPPAFDTGMPAASIFEVAVPLAFVIFQAEFMMRGPFK